jgi:ankyrin repeat protein
MPIHYAAWHGKADIMLELIKKGAVLDKEDKVCVLLFICMDGV